MTIEEIELRKILSQMLADNGINRKNIIDFVKDIIDQKVDKAIKQTVNETNIDAMVGESVKNLISSAVRDEVAKKVKRTLGSVSISLHCKEWVEKNERKLT